jgi:transposase
MLIETPQGPLEVDSHELPPSFPLVLPVCRDLGIAEVVDALCPMHHCEHVSHGQVVEFLMLHILQEPDRQPLYKLQEWAQKHHVHCLYDCEAAALNDDRVGRALEAISQQIGAIETSLVTRALERYHVPVDAIHWDLTNVTFTGAYEHSEVVRPGYGNGRVHDKQLNVSLHTTGEGGIPLRHETLPGNAHQGPLANRMLADLQKRLCKSDLLIVSDCAGISYDNIVTYRASGGHFLGPMQLTAAEEEFVAAVPPEAFVPLQYRSKGNPDCRYSYFDTPLILQRQKRAEPLEVRALVIHSTQGQERAARERRKRLDKALKRLETIRGYLNKARYAHEDYARKQLAGAIPASLQGIVEYELTGEAKQLQLRTWTNEAALAHTSRGDGRWLLVSDDWEHSPQELFARHREHFSIEARFRNFGQDLSVQPMWLHHDDRICGLLLVFILALMVYCLIELCSTRAKLEGDYYHKMTTRQLLYHFALSPAKLLVVRAPGQPATTQLQLADDHKYYLYRLGFGDPNRYLHPPGP